MQVTFSFDVGLPLFALSFPDPGALDGEIGRTAGVRLHFAVGAFFAVGKIGSGPRPPRGKLVPEMKDKSRPSEHGCVGRDIGGLLSFTKNRERSRGVLSGMHEDRFIRNGDLGAAKGGAPAEGEACREGSGAVG